MELSEQQCSANHYEDYNRERTQRCRKAATRQCTHCKWVFCADCANDHFHATNGFFKYRLVALKVRERMKDDNR